MSPIRAADPIDGKELAEGEGETVAFTLDGTSYEIDLSTKNADKFRGLFQDYRLFTVEGVPGSSSDGASMTG